MLRPSVRGAIRCLVSFFTWINVALLILIPAILLRSYVFSPAFTKETLVGKDQPIPQPGSGKTFYLSWQEPSQYEAFVYASTLPTMSNNATSFFDKAQLLWRTDSQTLENRYPQLQKSVSVTIPELVRNDRSKTRSLFLHVFAQTTRKDKTVPDMNDPYLVHSATPLVRWDSLFGASLAGAFSKGPSQSIFSGGSKLVVSKSVSWAMSLENHAYTREQMPAHISKALKLSSTLNQRKRYNPPMFVNSFTQNIPQAVELKQVSDGSARKQTYPETVDVRLELRGIKQGWITSKNTLIRIFEPDFFTKPGSRKGDDKNNAMRAILIALATIVYNFVARLSVTTLVTIIYCVLFACVTASLSIKAKLLFWLSSSSRWVGYSRVGFGIYLVAGVFATITSVAVGGLSNVITLLILVPPLFLLLTMTETPMNPQTWYDALRQGVQASQRSSDNSGAYSMINLEEGEGEDDGQNASARPQIKDPELVVSVRRDIDRVALWWTIRLLGPVFVLVFLYSLFAHSSRKTQTGTFAYIMINYATTLQWCQWIPQIVINHRTRSGTWIPVLANAYELAGTLLIVVAIKISGLSLSFGNMSGELPNQIFNAILVAQWIKYRFF